MGNDVRENRLRRMAERQGYALRRSRRRDPLAQDYGIYWIIDPTSDVIVSEGTRHDHGMSLEEAEKWLLRPPKRSAR